MPPTSSSQPPPSRPKRRGGPRPGAGAPRGNLNALKHGRRSAQFARLGAILAGIPETRRALLDLARRHRLKQRRAEEIAVLLLGRIVQHAQQVAGNRSSAPPPIDERRSIEPEAPIPDSPDPTSSPNTRRSIKPEPDTPHTIENQTRDPP